MPEPPKVFVSYSHDSAEHAARVLALADALRRDGIDVILDQYNPVPSEGWPRWMQRNMDAADFVLMVCTETYNRRVMGNETPGIGLGVQWESNLIYNHIYRYASQGHKYLPILFDGADTAHIPTVVVGNTYYQLANFQIEDGPYQALYRHLTQQPKTPAPDIGTLITLNPQPKLEPKSAQPWNVPIKRNPFFTGRKDVLMHLYNTFHQSNAVAITPAAVSGMGGIGKTQTAAEYAYRHRGEYDAVLWMFAESEATLRESFAEIARSLELPEANKEDQNFAIEAVKRWLASQSGWLLVLDNADDLAMSSRFLPNNYTGHVIFTSRATVIDNYATPVKIQKLNANDGALLLLRRAKCIEPGALAETAKPHDMEASLAISREVDGLPLALDQAGAYIEETRTTPSKYLKLYQEHMERALAEYGKGKERDHVSVAITFTLAFEKAKVGNFVVGDLLRLCAFLAPDDIPELIFTKGHEAHLGKQLGSVVNDSWEWNNLLGEACSFSLMSRDADKETMSIHRLVQVVVRNGMDEDLRQNWAERAVRSVNNIFPDVEFKNWPLCDQLLPHVQICAEWITKLHINTVESARLLDEAGWYLDDRGQYVAAEPLYMMALSIRQCHLGSDHIDTAQSLNNIASLYLSQGRYVEAEPLLMKSLEIHKHELGIDHLDTAAILSNLAQLYCSQERYVAAEPLYVDVLDISKRHLGTNHLDTAGSLSNLADLYWAQKRYSEAEPLLVDALEIYKRHLGTDHPVTAKILSSLAEVYRSQGRYSDAQPLHGEALSIRQRQLGSDHPDTAVSLNNLAGVYRSQGRYAEAEPLYRQALIVCEKRLGPHHPISVKVRENYNSLLQLMNLPKL